MPSYERKGKFALKKTDKGGRNCLPLLTTAKLDCWLLSDKQKTSLMSLRNATMHETCKTAQKKLIRVSLKSARTLNRAVFPANYNLLKLN